MIKPNLPADDIIIRLQAGGGECGKMSRRMLLLSAGLGDKEKTVMDVRGVPSLEMVMNNQPD